MRLRLTAAFLLFLPTLAAAKEPPRRRAKPAPPPSLGELKAGLASVAGAPFAERVTALRRCELLKTRDCVAFLDALYAQETEARLRLEVLRTLGRVGVDPAAQVLGRVVAGDDKTQRSTAVNALSTIKPPVDPQAFLNVLQDADLGVRTQAVAALGNYGTPRVAESLTRVLIEEAAPPALRTATRRALGKVVKHDAVRPWLRETALAPTSAFAPAFADLLHLAGAQPSPTGPLREAVYPHLASNDPGVRAAAADALGQLLVGKAGAAEHSLDLLRPLLRDPDEGVVFSAGVAIGQIVPVGKTLKAILTLCRAKSPALRALAFVALERSRDPRVVPAAAKGLADRSTSVRAAAIATLAQHGGRDAITALVNGLKKNKTGRLHHELLAALRRLTRANPGPLHADWKRWWSDAKDDFRLPKSGSVQASTRRGGETATRGAPTYYGSEVVSRRVTFIVDISGSMTARVKGAEGLSISRIELCKRELQGVINALPKKAHFNVVWFNNRFQSWMPQLTPAGKQQKASAMKTVAELKAGGGTNIFDPLEAAVRDPNVDTIYLLSDGAPSSGRIVDPPAILRELRKLNAARQVAIHTISIGSRSAFMQDLAKEHAGQAIQR